MSFYVLMSEISVSFCRYLSPWVSWRAMRLWSRRGSQWAERKPLGGPDSLKASSSSRSEPPPPDWSPWGRASRHHPGPDHSLQHSPWKDCSAGDSEGLCTGTGWTEKEIDVTHLSMRLWRLLTIPVAQLEVGKVNIAWYMIRLLGETKTCSPPGQISDHPCI